MKTKFDPSKKILFINYAGYMLNANTFIPDNSVAALAMVCIQKGYSAEVMDLQDPDTVGRVMEKSRHNYAGKIVTLLEENKRPDDKLLLDYQADRKWCEGQVVDELISSILKKIEKENVGIVAFKMWIGVGAHNAVKIAKAIRQQFPEVILTCGGPVAQYTGETFLKFSDVFDLVVQGEGEEIFEALLDDPKAVLQSKFLKSDFVRKFNRYPLPRYDKEIYPNIDQFFKMRVIDESRGCFNSCAFCVHNHLNGLGSRRRPIHEVVDEIERLQQVEGINFFRFAGSNPPWKYATELAQEIMRRGLKIHYSIFSSLNNCNPRDFGMMRESGLRSLFFGIESGDERICEIAHSKRNGGRDHILNVTGEAMKSDIFTSLSFIYPAPFDTAETGKKSLDLIQDIFKHDSKGSVMAIPPTLCPGSDWWNRMDHYGFKFHEGMSGEKYLLDILNHTYDFLLPKSAFADPGYSMQGKMMKEVYGECANFLSQVKGMGVTTDFDDASYMLAEMSGVPVAEYLKTMTHNLILGGSERLTSMVQKFNS